MLTGRGILLVIGGGIAAYKSLELVRLLTGAGAKVTPVLTNAGAQFVTPLTLGALCGQKVYRNLFDLTDESEMGHIQLSRAADLLVVAPATADIMAKMAQGLAGDLATTLLLATDKPVLIAPAMNVRMWEHPATRRNMMQLAEDGIHMVGPNTGDMACGEFGAGRMAEPTEIFDVICALLADGPLKGRRILVTSGPTHEPIDPVRYIANRSSGRQGSAIAQALVDLGAEVVFITGPAAAKPPVGVKLVNVETAREMLAAVKSALPVDAAVFAAAVADWRMATPQTNKIKKDSSGVAPALEFAENPDILRIVSNLGDNRPALVVGFAAETENVLENATKKRMRKGCDWIIANDVSPETGIMGGAENAVTFVTANRHEDWPRGSKVEVAKKLAARIAEVL